VSDSQLCARTVVGQLVAQGVTDVVLCPGSRSAAVALCLDAAAREGVLRLHVRIDERVAGFTALGLGRASGRPAAVVTTSGTAVANLVPAVLEAHHAAVPLVVVSADRPAELVGTGANQTTEQAELFSGLLRYRARISAAAPVAAWQAHTARAVLLATGATGGSAGPVQLNLELPAPLVTVGGDAGPVPGTPVLAGPRPAPVPILLSGTPRTLVVCGDASPAVGRSAAEFAEAAGLPLVAEASSNARVGTSALACGRLLLAGPLGSRVERAIVFGRPSLSRPVTALLSREDVELVVVTDRPDYIDPGWRAGTVCSAVEVEVGPADWLAAWRDADQAWSARVLGLTTGTPVLTGPELARLVVGAVPADQVLCLGNSNPIRDADLAPIGTEQGIVHANRGLSGIDGTVSTAIGVALGSGRPTTLLCGDIALVHDAGALVIPPGEPLPELRVVVADDAGGSIFATLEYGRPEFADAFERVFATPTGVDLVGLVAALGVPVRRLRTAEDVAAALAGRVTGLEVLVVEVDRAGRADLAASLAQLE
jgi:2-succinyl-5-enolpyruvyl-6-hydroxy-3-cyclohexene-1-carboxylate synthase